jgi:hypothetical protein
MAGNVARRPDGRWRARYRDAKGKGARPAVRPEARRHSLAGVRGGARARASIDPVLARVRVGEWSAVLLAGQVQLKPLTKTRYELARGSAHSSSLQVRAVVGCGIRRGVPVGGRALGPRARAVDRPLLAPGLLADDFPRGPGRPPRAEPCRRGEAAEDHSGRADVPRPRPGVELAAAAAPYGLLVRVLAYIGLRWGEMSALRVENLDLLRRRMRNQLGVRRGPGQARRRDAHDPPGADRATPPLPRRRARRSCRGQGPRRARVLDLLSTTPSRARW